MFQGWCYLLSLSLLFLSRQHLDVVINSCFWEENMIFRAFGCNLKVPLLIWNYLVLHMTSVGDSFFFFLLLLFNVVFYIFLHVELNLTCSKVTWLYFLKAVISYFLSFVPFVLKLKSNSIYMFELYATVMWGNISLVYLSKCLDYLIIIMLLYYTTVWNTK